MDRTTLHWFRLLTPGVIASILVFTLGLPELQLPNAPAILSGWEPVLIIIFIMIGYPYRVLNVRHWLLGSFWSEVNENIKSRLFALIDRKGELSAEQRTYLQEKRRLLNLFYRVVDNDESLKSKAKGVYQNGYLMTLGVDVAIVCFAFSVTHVVLYFVDDNVTHLYWAGVLLLVHVVVRLMLVPATESYHKKLSNEQLDVIEDIHAEDVRTTSAEILRNMP